MTEPTRPVTRVRRPTLSQPARPEPTPDPDPEAEAEREAIQAEARKAAAEEQAAAERASAGRAEKPPTGATREEIRREGHAVPLTPGFEPRDGDVLVVSYPDVTLPLPKQYAMMRFGGAIYTRQLRAGDDVDATARAISGWLTRTVEADGVAKYRRLVAEFVRKSGGGEG